MAFQQQNATRMYEQSTSFSDAPYRDHCCTCVTPDSQLTRYYLIDAVTVVQVVC